MVTIALESTPIQTIPKKKHGMLPFLVVLFLISYGLLALLVVEQDRTISNQRSLINQVMGDSIELTALKGKLVFGDITTGHLWTADMKDVLAADDGNPATMAPIHALDGHLREIVLAAFHARGGKGVRLPGNGAVSGKGRVDVRFAVDGAGELYLLTKSDGMIRRVIGVK